MQILNTIKKFILFSSLLLIISTSYAAPAIYLFLENGPAKVYKSLLENPDISGAQIIYSWKKLEPKKDRYDFSAIDADLRFLHSLHKKLFIQIQD